MSWDEDSAAWHQIELEGRRLQEELTRDPGYLEWLESIEAMALGKEKDDGDHGE